MTYKKQFSAKQRTKTGKHRTFKVVYYNFHRKIVNARECTAFHLSFFESKDRNLTAQLLKIRGYYQQKAIHILWSTFCEDF